MFALVLAVAALTTAPPATSLTITTWPEGRPGASKTWTLGCTPTRGTLPRRDRACRLLLAQTNPFRPIPGDAACTQIYGGPQVAFVRGTFRGKRVYTYFQRRDGCEISRWQRVKFLFPIAVGVS